MSENKANIGSIESLQKFWKLLDDHRQVLEEARELTLKQQGATWLIAAPSSFAIFFSIESLLILARMGKTGDCFVLARVIFETIINICFVFAGGDGTAERAMRYAKQKGSRDLSRMMAIGGSKLSLKWEAIDGVDLPDDISEALQEFTSKKGREIRKWTPQSIKQKIELIDKKYGSETTKRLFFPFFAIYRHASEIAHGTFFGVMFSMGLTDPKGLPKSEAELVDKQTANLTMILLMISMSISSLLLVFSREDEGFKKYFKKSDDLLKEIQSQFI